MMLIVLDKDPRKAASLVPDKIKFKQMIELCQLICSCGISNTFKPIKQGKELQLWIYKNKLFTYRYLDFLFFWSLANTKIKPKTILKIYKIRNDLFDCIENKKRIKYPTTAILRYKEGYECKYPTNTELPIDIAISIYNDYVHNFKRWE